MTITDAGLVGIGTASPATTLEVGGVGKFWTGVSGGLGTVALGDNGTTAYSVGIFRGLANSISSSGNVLNVGGYDGIVFTSSNANLGSQTERMRITAAGLVGIGTPAPNNNLEVYSSSNPSIAVTSTSASLYCYYGMAAGTVGGTLFTFAQSYNAVYPAGCTALANDTYGIILNASNASGILRFQTNATEQMRITSAGKVGIGTTTPNAKLSINTTTFTSVADTAQVAIENTEAWSQGLAFHIWGSGTYNSGYASGYIGSPNTSGKLFMSGGARVIDNPDGGGNLGGSQGGS